MGKEINPIKGEFDDVSTIGLVVATIVGILVGVITIGVFIGIILLVNSIT